MILEHELNRELSEQVYNDCSNVIEKKACYNNVFNVLTHGYGECFYRGEWKIAYGYISSVQNLMVRHCFIITEDGQAIDPTLAISKYNDDRVYISFVVLGLNEYMDALKNNEFIPDFFGKFREEERLAREWTNERGWVCCG